MYKRPPLVVALHLGLLVLTLLVGVVFSSLPVVVYLLVMAVNGHVVTGEPGELPAFTFVLGTLFQDGAFFFGSVGLALLLPIKGERALSLPSGEVAERLKTGLGLHRTPIAWWFAAGLGAVTIGLAASRIAFWLQHVNFPSLGGLEIIEQMMQNADVVVRYGFLFCVVVLAPVVEELIFRGYLWRVLEGMFPPSVVLGVTTLAFAAIHMDPIHVLALLPTSLFLGLLRWHSRSLLPCMFAHFINNALATVFTLMADGTTETEEFTDVLTTTLGSADALAFAGGLFSCLCVAAAWSRTRSQM